MPMTERFYSVNGQMMGYEEGGVKKDFLTDHLGSITAEIDQTQTRTYDTRYSAYGRNNWSTGTGCGFGWVGSYGYRETGLFHMSHYVRARHYSYVTGGWSTVDPLWPDESAYGYGGGRATVWVDPSGMRPARKTTLLEKIKDAIRHGHCVKECSPVLKCFLFPLTCRHGQLDNCLSCLDPWPRVKPRPRLGGGNADYEAGWTPWTFNYGTCCGYHRACNCNSNPIIDGKGKPDCVDAACKQHDIDNPTAIDYLQKGGHAKLCASLALCDCGAMYSNPLDRANCKSAKEKIMALYCLHAIVLP